MILSHRFQPFLLACAVALIFCLPTFVNGTAIFYEDSYSYVARGIGPLRAIGADFSAGRAWLRDVPDQKSSIGLPADVVTIEGEKRDSERVWRAGRSIYYSIVTYLTYVVAGFSGVVALQALLVAVPVTLLWKRCLHFSNGLILGLATILTVTTSLGVIVGLIMPDYMAAIVILVTAMLVAFTERLLTLDIFVLAAIAIFAAIVHESHLVVLSILTAGAWIVYAADLGATRSKYSFVPPAFLTLVLIASLSATLGYFALAKYVTGKPLTRLPHIAAHLSAMPLTADFLNRKCPEVDLQICAYRQKLPMGWLDFMFGDFSRRQTPAEKLRISEEQIPLLLAVFWDRPVDATIAFGAEAMKQLIRFSYLDLEQDRRLPYFDRTFPQSITEKIASSVFVKHSYVLNVLSTLQQVVVLIAIPIIVMLQIRPPAASASGRPWKLLSGVVIVGVLINGLVCGILAFPYDRFQVRVIWLVPFLALTGLVMASSAVCGGSFTRKVQA